MSIHSNLSSLPFVSFVLKLIVLPSGCVFLDGVSRVTRLPPIQDKSQVSFAVEKVSSSKVRVYIESQEKQVSTGIDSYDILPSLTHTHLHTVTTAIHSTSLSSLSLSLTGDLRVGCAKCSGWPLLCGILRGATLENQRALRRLGVRVCVCVGNVMLVLHSPKHPSHRHLLTHLFPCSCDCESLTV